MKKQQFNYPNSRSVRNWHSSVLLMAILALYVFLN